MSDAPTIHIGYAKAASTTIQSYLGAHPDIHFPDRREISKLLSSRAWFDFDAAKLRRYVEEQMHAASAAGQRLVLSHERLAGNPHAGHYDACTIAERIATAIPEAQVVIVLREQFGMIRSIYSQYVRAGGTWPLENYLLPRQTRRPVFDWRVYRYHHLIDAYYQRFGPEKVCVLLTEDLRDRPADFWSKLAQFFGVTHQPQAIDASSKNEGLGDNQVERERQLNFFRARRFDPSISGSGFLCNSRLALGIARLVVPLLPSSRRGSARQPMVDDIRSTLRGRFSESNQHLGSQIGRDLASLGYECD